MDLTNPEANPAWNLCMGYMEILLRVLGEMGTINRIGELLMARDRITGRDRVVSTDDSRALGVRISYATVFNTLGKACKLSLPQQFIVWLV